MYRPQRDWGRMWLMSSIAIIKRATRLVATIIKFSRHSIYVGQGTIGKGKRGIFFLFFDHLVFFFFSETIAMLGHGT